MQTIYEENSDNNNNTRCLQLQCSEFSSVQSTTIETEHGTSRNVALVVRCSSGGAGLCSRRVRVPVRLVRVTVTVIVTAFAVAVVGVDVVAGR